MRDHLRALLREGPGRARPGHGIGTHAFRAANGNDEPPENRYGGWQFPDLVGWNGYPAGLRDRLVSANFGSAVLGLSDHTLNSHLARAKPQDVPFDPDGGG